MIRYIPILGAQDILVYKEISLVIELVYCEINILVSIESLRIGLIINSYLY